MRRIRVGLLAATALAGAVAVAACGFGAGPSSSGTATLTVTRDYGSETLLEATDDDPPASETVLRLLDSEAEIATRYGGGFVQSIDGLAGTPNSDWFFYINGTESPVGAAEVRVQGGDRIWWDYREWRAAMSVPAVVGSWPEPFAQASSDDFRPVHLVCRGVARACETAAGRLAEAGAKPRVSERATAGTEAPRMLVGPWTKVRTDPAVDGLHGGPASTGVFATFKESIRGGWHLIGLNPGGEPVRDLGSRTGLVAALGRPGNAQTWIVTGSGPPAVFRASKLLDARSLRNRYAVAAAPHESVPLPVVDEAGGA